MDSELMSFNTVYEDMLYNLDTFVYVSDFETDEILYLNKKVITQIGIMGDYGGKKCWEVLMGKSERCSFCPKRTISRTDFNQKYQWENVRPESGFNFQHIGRLIHWPAGRIAFFQQSLNISDYRMAEKQARTRLQRQELMAAISKSFISSQDINVSIDNALKMTAEFMNYDKALLAIISDDYSMLNITNEYRGSNMRGDRTEWNSKHLKKGDIIYDRLIAGRESYLELYGQQCEYFPSCYLSGLRTSLIFPIKFDGRFLGVVKFDMLDIDYKWEEDDIQLAGLVASIFAGVIHQLRMSKSLELMSTVVQHTEQIIAYFNSNGQFEFFNDALCEVSGYSREELENHGFYLLHDENVIQYLQTEIIRDIQNHQKRQAEFPLSCKDKSVKLMNYSFFPAHEGMGAIAVDVTEARKMQREFGITKQRLEIAVTSSGIGIWDVDIKQQVIIFNEEFASIHRLPEHWKSPLSLKKWFAYVKKIEYEEYQAGMLDFAENYGQEKKIDTLDIPYQFEDGSMVYTRVSSTQLLDENGQVDHIIGMTWDVTLDVEKNKELSDTKNRLAIALDASRAGVWEVSLNENTITFDGMLASLLKLEASSPMDLDEYCRYILQHIGPEHKEYIAALKQGLRGLDDISGKIHRHMFENDEIRYISNTMRIINDMQGKTERIIGMAMDVTESQLMEMQIRDALEKQALVLRNFNGVLVSIGNDRIVNLFGGTSMFGFKSEDAIGQNIHDLYKDAPIIRKSVERAFKEGNYEFLYQNDSIISQCQLNPILNCDGEQIGMLFVGRDITEQYEMQKKLEKAIKVAEDASRAKSDFLARMSHEIRTPMNAIIGMTKIGTDAADAERKQYCLNRIDVASENLLEIINQILDMSKIEANKLELERVEFDMKKLLDDIRIVMDVRINEKIQKLDVVYENELYTTFIGDETRLSQIITNLLSNAVKFTPEQGKIEIRVREMENKGKYAMLKISVSDNGIGVKKEQQERIFHSFEQADGSTSRKFGGTGLGLAICKKLVEMMHGQIWLQSQPGKGATFTFTVRLKKGTPLTEAKIVETHQENNDVLRGKTVLLAEDSEINREIVITLLSELDVTVEYAENGTQAVAIFEQNPEKYDLILMDVQMPEMDGYEATRRIRALPHEYAAKVGIVAMTANVFKEDVERCLAAGMNAHISKPINLTDVQEKMGKYIR